MVGQDAVFFERMQHARDRRQVQWHPGSSQSAAHLIRTPSGWVITPLTAWTCCLGTLTVRYPMESSDGRSAFPLFALGSTSSRLPLIKASLTVRRACVSVREKVVREMPISAAQSS